MSEQEKAKWNGRTPNDYAMKIYRACLSTCTRDSVMCKFMVPETDEQVEDKLIEICFSTSLDWRNVVMSSVIGLYYCDRQIGMPIMDAFMKTLDRKLKSHRGEAK